MAATDTLTDKAIKADLRAAIKAGAPKRISDGGGLYFEARPSGAGWWRLRYWSGGKEGMLSLGTYPDVPLKLARERRDEARRALATGIDPSEQRKADKAVQALRAEEERTAAAGLPAPGTFEHAAREWHTRMTPSWSPG